MTSAKDAGLRGLFGVTLFIAACLLFWIQLLISKLLLPLLGGSSAVWNTCLVFFQLALLLGYLYAHLTADGRFGRLQSFLHPALLLVAAVVLPVSLAGRIGPSASDNPIPWLLGALLAMIGLPFTVLAGTAPLLQAWFVRTGAKSAEDPYFLYAASNLGSLAALLSYPTLVEPNLTLLTQSRWWTDGYLALAGLVIACALTASRAAPSLAPAGDARRAEEIPVGEALKERLLWLLLAFVPSSLLLGVTTHLTTDIAAVPLLWVIPLVLYLLSYVMAFQTSLALSPRFVAGGQAVLMALLAGSLVCDQGGQPIAFLLIHLASFFVTALFCHMELARRRPAASRLTEFYLLLALGGALGGMFNALLAPLLFQRILEYRLCLVLACFLRPGAWPRRGAPLAGLADLGLPLLLFGVLLFVKEGLHFNLSLVLDSKALMVAVPAAAITLLFYRRPLRFGLAVAALLVAGLWTTSGHAPLARMRNFYGQITVMAQQDPPAHILYHGPTAHGAQSLLPEFRLTPISYYHPNGPLGQVFAAIETRRPLGRVGVVGLGAGTVSCYARPGESWAFFDINPAVVAVAKDPQFFTYLRDCPAQPAIILGDARLSLEKEPDAGFDLLILDAFSSDSIPLHLITREAVDLYFRKLRPGGLLVFHISNYYLDLAPVLGDIAASLRLSSREYDYDPPGDDGTERNRPERPDASEWAVLSRDPQGLGDLPAAWEPLPTSPARRPWTDDFSNLFGALMILQSQ